MTTMCSHAIKNNQTVEIISLLANTVLPSLSRMHTQTHTHMNAHHTHTRLQTHTQTHTHTHHTHGVVIYLFLKTGQTK